jgi:hypothetical protein
MSGFNISRTGYAAQNPQDDAPVHFKKVLFDWFQRGPETQVDASGVAVRPSSPGSAPQKLNLAPVNGTFQRLGAAAKEDARRGIFSEYGVMISATPKGEFHVGNEIRALNAIAFKANYSVPPGNTPLMYFHTHPTLVHGKAFGIGDITQFMKNNLNASMIQYEDKQYGVLRTKKTPDAVDFSKLANAYVDRGVRLMIDRRLTFEEAQPEAMSELMHHLGLAYYEGENGVLNLVQTQSGPADWTRGNK